MSKSYDSEDKICDSDQIYNDQEVSERMNNLYIKTTSKVRGGQYYLYPGVFCGVCYIK